MKLLVNDSRIKAYYKDENFYSMDNKKVDESKIAQIFMSMQEFKEILQLQSDKRNKLKKKDE